jgi:hypothetical protein
MRPADFPGGSYEIIEPGGEDPEQYESFVGSLLFE